MDEAGVIRVFLLDDHEVVRRGVRELLEAEDDIEVVGEAGTAEQALARIPPTRPHVAVLDVRLPDGDGVSVCRDTGVDVGALGSDIVASSTTGVVFRPNSAAVTGSATSPNGRPGSVAPAASPRGPTAAPCSSGTCPTPDRAPVRGSAEIPDGPSHTDVRPF
jgi:hypothetical protein